MKFSVIIAAYNEGPQIASALKRLHQISKTSPAEIIVVDGGSDDGTAESAQTGADIVLRMDKPNRGAQWHAGAQKATGDLFFFLRADAQPPGNWQQALEHFWLSARTEHSAAVGFSVNYGSEINLRLLSAWSNSRVKRGMIGADHGVCTTREIYEAVGGFPPFSELEDLEFSRRLSKQGKTHLLPDRIYAAARRLRAQGTLPYVYKRLWLEMRYKLGIFTPSVE